MEDKRVGVVGLGNMGSAIARRLLQSGFAVTVFNRTPGRAAPLVALGATQAPSMRELAASQHTVVTCVADTPDVQQVILGSDGVLAGAKPGTTIIECSTIDPITSKQIGDTVRAAGSRMIDAGVGGLPKDVDAGKGSFMVGATEDDLPYARPVIEALGELILCGGPGTGITMKVINNLLSQTIQAADAEAFVLGAKAGLDPRLMLRVLSQTAADNKALRTRVPDQVLGGNYQSGFTCRLALKDQRVAHEMATRLGVPLFTLSQARQLLTLAIAMGRGEQAVLAVAAALEDVTGVRLSKRD